MRQPINDVSAALAAAVLFASGGLHAAAQPLDAYTFKGAHNSYERAESLPDQVLAMNCWALELDLCWSSDSQQPVIRHNTTPPCVFSEQGPLSGWLAELTSDPNIWSRLTMLYLDIQAFDCVFGSDCLSWEFDRVQDLIAVLDAYLPRGSVYTVRELDADGGVWPSPQELLRRGKSFVVFVSRGSGWDQYSYFHHQAGTPGDADASTSLINRSAADMPNGPGPVPDDRLLWRTFPGTLAQISESEDRNHFENGVARGFNIVAINYLDRNWSFFGSTMPPMPFYVDRNVSPFDVQLGTLYNPMRTLAQAVNRINATTTAGVPRTEPFPIRVRSGILNIGAQPLHPPVPLEIKADSGPVLLVP